mmetsp:Transcript_51445/g.132742  ORF Transcript_51445/g.132742 Transcript_51445/m.132742 type:complete len:221 (-) Transcript_51445:340-1002(-)
MAMGDVGQQRTGGAGSQQRDEEAGTDPEPLPGDQLLLRPPVPVHQDGITVRGGAMHSLCHGDGLEKHIATGAWGHEVLAHVLEQEIFAIVWIADDEPVVSAGLTRVITHEVACPATAVHAHGPEVHAPRSVSVGDGGHAVGVAAAFNALHAQCSLVVYDRPIRELQQDRVREGNALLRREDVAVRASLAQGVQREDVRVVAPHATDDGRHKCPAEHPSQP